MSDLSRKMFLAETAAVREHLAEQEQQATAKAEAALAPLKAKARELEARRRAEHRAAVLREAADVVRDGDLGPRDGMSSDYEDGWWNSRAAAENRVRRMIDEEPKEAAPTTELSAPATVSAAVAPPTNRAAPSLRAGLRDEIVKALGRITTVLPVAHRREQADHVLAVLYREWPWLRAEAEDAEPTDRDAVLREAADRAEVVALRLRLKHDTGAANGACEVMDELRRMADETATEQAQAHAPLTEWRVEILDGDEWMPASGLRRDRSQAAEQLRMASERRPLWNDGTPVRRRLVRETTTYTVEAETGPAAGARQDGTET